METKVLKYIEGKSKNRRINIYVLEDENEIAFQVHTKRLIDFKSRKISTSNVIYGYHTFRMLSELYDFLLNDSDLKRITNRLNKAFENDRMNVKTNVKQ